MFAPRKRVQLMVYLELVNVLKPGCAYTASPV